MNPITHFLVGWVALEKRLESKRDKALVCLAGVVPDFDGMGIGIDFVTRTVHWAQTDYYQEYHRMLGHGLPAALVIAAAAAAMARQRMRVAVLAFIAVHLHFLCDLLGSRGSTAEDIWPIYYLAPVSSAAELSWSYQWPLVGWQNMLLSVCLLLATMARATVRGYSPVCLVSVAGDAMFVATLRQWRLRLGGLFRVH